MNESENQVDTTNVDATETPTQHENIDSIGEGESTPQNEGGEQRSPETPEAKRARLQRQLDQLNKKFPPKEDGGSREEGSKKSSEEVDERFARQDLKLAGITDRKEQDIVMKYARTEGIDAEKAISHPVVKAALDYHRAQTSTPAPSTRTGGNASNSLEYWAEQAKKGKLPSDPEMRRQLRKMRIFAR
jgi:hypothetical protein